MGGGGLADTMFNHAALTGSARYHMSESWSIAGVYSHHFGETSPLFDEVIDRFELFPERSVVEWSAGLDIGWTPVFGKFALVESYIMHFDMTVLLGASAVLTSRSPDPKVGGSAGLAMRLYLSPWLAITGEVRDQVFVETYNAGDELVNHVLAQAGFSIFFPFEYAYRYPR
jgi:outer membrane beta-barrel protein